MVRKHIPYLPRVRLAYRNSAFTQSFVVMEGQPKQGGTAGVQALVPWDESFFNSCTPRRSMCARINADQGL
jgi:hypothetical protein